MWEGRTAWRANGDLGVEDVFAGSVSILFLEWNDRRRVLGKRERRTTWC